jgi:pimeloyl-ACP methyl ester carboxylesterase
MTTTDTYVESGYAQVNGLDMYYETHGTGRPLVLLHGALSAIGTSFGAVLPGLAKNRRVIAVELQAHGRTADVDRPLTVGQFADDAVALLEHLGVEQADFLGYSMGAEVALEVATRYPERVGRLVLATIAYTLDGVHPGLLDGIEQLRPEHMYGSPFHDEYVRIAPDPEQWATLVEKVKEFDRNLPQWPAEAVRSLAAPTMLVFGDSDMVRPEHAVEMFRLLGGGVAGDVVGLPSCQLAVLPGTTHVGLMQRADWLVPMVRSFLDTAAPAAAEAPVVSTPG